MTRLTLEQNKLYNTIFIQIPVGVLHPVFGNQLALDNAGLFRVSTYVIGMLIAGHCFRGRFFVVKDNGHIIHLCFLDNHRCCCGIHQVNGQCINTFGQHNIHLVILL